MTCPSAFRRETSQKGTQSTQKNLGFADPKRRFFVRFWPISVQFSSQTPSARTHAHVRARWCARGTCARALHSLHASTSHAQSPRARAHFDEKQGKTPQKNFGFADPKTRNLVRFWPISVQFSSQRTVRSPAETVPDFFTGSRARARTAGGAPPAMRCHMHS